MTCRCRAYNSVIAADSPFFYVPFTVGSGAPPSPWTIGGSSSAMTIYAGPTAPSGNGSLHTGPDLSQAFAAWPYLDSGLLAGAPLAGGPFSIECWINPDGINRNFTSGASDVVLMEHAATSVAPRHLVWVHTNTAGTLVIDTMILAQPGGDLINGGPPVVPPGLWHHVVFTQDHGQSPMYVMYVDCAVQTTNSGSSADDTLALDTLLVGDGPFSGLIADVAYYPYALSRAQVMCHYEAGSGQRCCGRGPRAQIQIID